MVIQRRTEDFVKARDVGDFPELDLLGFRIEDVEVLLVKFNRADVGVGPEHDVLMLGLLLVDLFDLALLLH